MVDLGWKMLLHDKVRSLITVTGVAFAVTLILVQVGLFIGILDNATVTIEHLPADLWVTSRNTPNVDFAHGFPEGAIDLVRSAQGVERADNLLVAFLRIALPTGAEEHTIVYAMEDFPAWSFPWNVVEGDPADLRRGPYLFMDDTATRRFGPFEMGEYREVLGRRMKIIGRTRDARSFTTTPISFMDFKLAQTLSPRDLAGKTHYIVVKTSPDADIEAVKAELQRRLPYNDVFTRDEWAGKTRKYWVQQTGIGFDMAVTVILGCIVGIVVVGQTLYTSTTEHLREFGTLKAIGGSNFDIYRILIRQAGFASIAGFVLGMLPTYIVRPIVARADLKLIVTPWLIGVTLAGTVVMCLGAAMVSFRKVSSIDPALVFRQ